MAAADAPQTLQWTVYSFASLDTWTVPADERVVYVTLQTDTVRVVTMKASV